MHRWGRGGGGPGQAVGWLGQEEDSTSVASSLQDFSAKFTSSESTARARIRLQYLNIKSMPMSWYILGFFKLPPNTTLKKEHYAEIIYI